jgi:Rad3-related DNA helicase
MAAKQLEFVERSYVLMRDKTMFQFKEIYGSNLFSHILEPKANRFLFMSATILNQNEFCRDLGIPKEETAVISVTSEFHKDNRPVYFMPTSKMSYGWNKPDKAALRDKMAKKVISLCGLHAEDSGIVHTGSFLIAKWLIGELEGKIPHEIVTHKPEDGLGRDDIIEEFTDNKGEKPMLLISPSITEGLDLKDDSARFAIFVKVPYPFLGDEWVKRRLELSEEWYTRQAMINMIQGSGRIVRTPEDWGNTYILDESFSNLWYRFKPFAPEWWKEAFSKIK